MYIIVGGEWTPESYSTYLESMAGLQRVYSFMGMAELGLNYFLETEETLMLRHLLAGDRDLSGLLFGDLPFCPMIFSYDETEIYIETVKDQESRFESIVMTTLEPNRALPLIRYKGGDTGKVLSREQINNALRSLGYPPVFGTPGSPILAHFGRGRGIAQVYPEQIKEIIYDNWGIASTATGNFRLSRQENIIHLEMQLREGLTVSAEREKEYFRAFSCLPLHVSLYRYESFPYVLDFERKVQYVSQNSRGPWKREKAGLSTAL